VTLAAAVLPLGCTAPQPKTALQIPEAETRARVRTVCLHAPRYPFRLAESDLRPGQLEELLRASLEGAGLAVVSSARTTEIAQRVAVREGGVFDAHTGQRDERKVEHVRRSALRALHDELGCDAALVPTVEVVVAPWVNGTASWDGASDSLGSGWGAHGRVGALSLWVSIDDVAGGEIYFGTGGIEVVSRLESGFWSDEFKHIATDELARDADRNRRAVHASLEPFLWAYTGRPTPTPLPRSIDEMPSRRRPPHPAAP
jgi:hypothetical protein